MNLSKPSYSLRKKCPYSELFWSAFSHIQIEYLVRMRENTVRKISEYGHFSSIVASAVFLYWDCGVNIHIIKNY